MNLRCDIFIRRIRFECAVDSCEWALTNWNDGTYSATGLDYLTDADNSNGFTGSDGRKFRLERLYYFSMQSPNGYDMTGYNSYFNVRSCDKDYSQY